MKKKYTIEYHMYSTLGKVRRNNEDNYFCDGQYRKDVSIVDDEYLTGIVTNENNDMLAVFDGMGGEACGEIASLVASEECAKFSANRKDYEEYIYELQGIMNTAIVEATKKRSLVLMGTTSALIQFAEDDIYVSNVGDSRIYKLSRHKLKQITEDHVAPGYAGKAPLTKFLGIPDERIDLSPYLAMGSYKVGDIYLLTTDGITDMLSDEEIQVVIDQKGSMKENLEALVKAAMDKGGIDNATVILCKIVHSKSVK